MLPVRYQYVSLIAIGMLLFIGTAQASAGPVTDIPEAINDALFGGGNLFGAQALLTAIVMVSIGLLLAMLKLNYVATFIVMFCVLGALTAIGWAEVTLLLICALFVVGMFAKKMAEYLGGGSSVEED